MAAASALLLLAPLMLTIALMIRLEDGGPALFKQVRVGKDGRPFTAVQVPHDGAGRRAAEGGSCNGSNEGDGVLFKIRDDPRITKIGAGCAAGRSTSCRS